MPAQPAKQTLFVALAVVSLVVIEGLVIVGGRRAEDALDLRRHTQAALLAISEVKERKDHAAVRPAAPAAPVSLLPANPGGPVILRAEDNEANIETLGGYLEAKGLQMPYATNGVEAVKLAQELRPAAILMDVQMPVLDGLTAIRQIRADPALQDISIVALTGLAMPGDRERCLAAGAVEYLSKPVRLKELVALIEKLLPRTGEGGGI